MHADASETVSVAIEGPSEGNSIAMCITKVGIALKAYRALTSGS